MKLRQLKNIALMAASVVIVSSANAGSYSFDFFANDNSYQVNGTLTTANVLNAVSGYDILGISGLVTGLRGGLIDSLVSNPNQPNTNTDFGFNYDNNLFPSSTPQLSSNGVLFTTTGGSKWNLWGNTPTDYSLGFYSPGATEVHGTFLAAAVPEPETYAMLLVGLGLVGSIARRRKDKNA